MFEKLCIIQNGGTDVINKCILCIHVSISIELAIGLHDIEVVSLDRVIGSYDIEIVLYNKELGSYGIELGLYGIELGSCNILVPMI